MKNVVIDSRAMTATGLPVKFFSEGALASRLAKDEYVREPLITVGATTLNEAVSCYGIPDFIGMDIEAAEIEILNSSRDLLTRNKISFCIDTNHEENTGWTFGRVESILRECGYTVETGMPGGFYTTWGWKE